MKTFEVKIQVTFPNMSVVFGNVKSETEKKALKYVKDCMESCTDMQIPKNNYKITEKEEL